MSNMRRLLLATLCIAVAFATAAPAAAGADRHGGPTVVPPQSRIFGNTYGQWNAKWWQWLYQTPLPESPVLSGLAGDPTTDPITYSPVDCSAGQRGPVWFLGGTFLPNNNGPGSAASVVYRTCDIPAGTYLFLPLLNSAADNLGCVTNTTFSAAQLIASATGNIDSILEDSLSASIDGHAVTGLRMLTVPTARHRRGSLIECPTITSVNSLTSAVDLSRPAPRRLASTVMPAPQPTAST